MAKKREFVRFAVGSPNGPKSGVWRLWRSDNPLKSDVFLAARSIAGVMKVSFHESGEIHDAFTSAYFAKHAEAVGPNRKRLEWQRGDYGTLGAVRLYQLGFPQSELRVMPSPGADVTWIPAHPGGDATFVDFVIARPGVTSLEFHEYAAALPKPIAQWTLPNGEQFLATARYVELGQKIADEVSRAARLVEARNPSAPWLAAPSARFIVIATPVDGVGSGIETAWPCTLG